MEFEKESRWMRGTEKMQETEVGNGTNEREENEENAGKKTSAYSLRLRQV